MAFSTARYVDARGANITQIKGSQHNYFHHDNVNRENEAFEALRRVSIVDAQYNSRHRSCPPCDSGTRTDILDKIYQWVFEAGGHSICCLYGIAGSGKSAIAQSVSEHIAEKKKLAASIFINRMEREGCKKEHIITTVAYQLTISIPVLKCLICDVIVKDETILNAVFTDQLLKLIIEPLQSLPYPDDPSMIMVIDGLDECEDFIEVAQFITKLADPSSNLRLPLRFFVTSRPEPFIRAIFENPEINPKTLHFSLRDFRADADIHLFLERRLRVISRLRSEVMSEISLPWPSNEDLAALVEKSAGLFIYASTSVMFICDKNALPHKRLEAVLTDGSNPISWGRTDLDRLYTQILSASSNVDHFMLVIGAIILVRMPLSPRGLSYLLELDLGCLQLVLERLHSILSIPEDPHSGVVTPFHLSLHDFLVSKERAGRYFVDPSLTHAQLARFCLKRIRTLPRFTFPTFRHPIHCWDAVIGYLQRADPGNRIITQYACRYWSSHVLGSSRKDLMDDMKVFCRHYVLPWRVFLEIEVQENNVIWGPENQEKLMHALRVHANATARFTWSTRTRKIKWSIRGLFFVTMVGPTVTLWSLEKKKATAVIFLGFWVLSFFFMLLWQYLMVRGPISMALFWRAPSVPQKGVETCVIEVDLMVAKMPFVWRCMFYRALTPKVSKMLEEVMGPHLPNTQPTNTQQEAGESRV